MCAAIAKPVDSRAFPPACMAAAATALQEQKLKIACAYRHGDFVTASHLLHIQHCKQSICYLCRTKDSISRKLGCDQILGKLT